MLVWFHGGGLSTGQGGDMMLAVTDSEAQSPVAGDMYGPQFLIEYNLVIVTVNYRLGPLGQLSLDTGLVSGNQVQGGTGGARAHQLCSGAPGPAARPPLGAGEHSLLRRGRRPGDHRRGERGQLVHPAPHPGPGLQGALQVTHCHYNSRQGQCH